MIEFLEDWALTFLAIAALALCGLLIWGLRAAIRCDDECFPSRVAVCRSQRAACADGRVVTW